MRKFSAIIFPLIIVKAQQFVLFSFFFFCISKNGSDREYTFLSEGTAVPVLLRYISTILLPIVRRQKYNVVVVAAAVVGGWVNQAYSRLLTTHGHITDCKLDSVVYVGVCVVI